MICVSVWKIYSSLKLYIYLVKGKKENHTKVPLYRDLIARDLLVVGAVINYKIPWPICSWGLHVYYYWTVFTNQKIGEGHAYEIEIERI